jgi:hypothetical protein
MVTSEDLELAINRISKTINNGELILVKHIPSPLSLAANCISNVASVQNLYGGKSEYGWVFLHRCSEKYGDYLILTHHCIWSSPTGSLVDITPFHIDSKHQPKTIDGKVIFLLDQDANPISKDNFIIPQPSKFFAVIPNRDIDNYVKKLQEKEFQFYKDEFIIDLSSK